MNRPEPLRNTRILSLALNLPGPAALLRCARMGAQCCKIEPPAAPGQASADPMGQHNRAAYAQLHAGVQRLQAQLKTPEGQALLHAELARADVLLTSFRPSALGRLGLDWERLHARYPRLSLVRIVGVAGPGAEQPGHDLTYLAGAGLISGTELPATLYADMGGALMASEAVLQALLERAHSGSGCCIEVALADAAAWLALPRDWGLSSPEGEVGGQHAGYRVYPCADGRVAVAALEPHFADRLCAAAGLSASDAADDTGPAQRMRAAATHQAVARFMQTQTRAQLDALANDIPLFTMA